MTIFIPLFLLEFKSSEKFRRRRRRLHPKEDSYGFLSPSWEIATGGGFLLSDYGQPETVENSRQLQDMDIWGNPNVKYSQLKWKHYFLFPNSNQASKRLINEEEHKRGARGVGVW
jgi:hypothetical protein